MKIKKFSTGLLDTNCYVVYHANHAIIVDPAGAGQEVQQFARGIGQVDAVVNTHGHADHIWRNAFFVEQFSAPLWIHQADAGYLSDGSLNLCDLLDIELPKMEAQRLLKDGDRLQIGDSYLEVLHTPGHTPGSICLIGDTFLLSGDTLFHQGVGRTDLPGGDSRQLSRSLGLLRKLASDMTVYPGHGGMTSIGPELHE